MVVHLILILHRRRTLLFVMDGRPKFLREKLTLQSLVSIISKLRIFGQTLCHENVTMFSPFVIGCDLIDNYITCLVFGIGLVVIISFDWVVPHQQHMTNDPKTE